ncbi:hypothetical protein EJ03DRAFT_324785 [Teratosphaeria nubilosa]|uniref:Uncharacterized protein n=1 Tax=Teratosphaeria nubilosa TaxID=161662 RepID=A0A6G1LIG1_9PEZI|nr:hypothetical protein EJ03DRAFT_324785 [Teratosphaeria nubilosa]
MQLSKLLSLTALAGITVASPLALVDRAGTPNAGGQSCKASDNDGADASYTTNIGMTWDDSATEECTILSDAIADICSSAFEYSFTCIGDTGNGYAQLKYKCPKGNGGTLNAMFDEIFPNGDLLQTGFNCPSH